MRKLARSTRQPCVVLLLTAAIFWAFFVAGPNPQPAEARPQPPDPIGKPTNTTAVSPASNSAVSFEANHGQLDERVKFSARGSGYRLFLTATEAVFVIPERTAPPKTDRPSKFVLPSEPSARPRRAVAVKMTLVGADGNAKSQGAGELAGKHNYFIGDDESKWRRNVPLYQRAISVGVYPGVDVEWHSSVTNGIEHDFKLAPSAPTEQIEWQIEGADLIRIDGDGSLVISTLFGDLRQLAPATYQEINGQRSTVESRFEQRGGNRVGFVVGPYDRSRPLTIDPVTDLVYSTYLGGEGTEEGCNSIATGPNGTVYLTGTTPSTQFPTTTGVFDQSFGGGNDVFVTRLSGDGSQLVFSTYLGGGAGDGGHGIAVDSAGNAYVTGVASASEALPFPSTMNTPYPNLNGDTDAFIAKLDPSGSTLLYSTFLGGSSQDTAYGIALRSGEAYITGQTFSIDFPTTPGAADTTFNGQNDVFVAKLDVHGESFDFLTFIGGFATDVGYGITIDPSGNVYVCGLTWSADLGVTPGAYDGSYNGTTDAFLSKLVPNGSAFTYTTFIGGAAEDLAYSVAADVAGNAYIAGYTQWFANFPHYPVTPGAFDTFENDGYDAVVTKFNPSGSALVFSTFLGGDAQDIASGIALDTGGNIVITGSTGGQWPTTLGAYDRTISAFSPDFIFNDVFLTKLSPSGASLLYSTYIGGNYPDRATGLALNNLGEAFLTGQTYHADQLFPVTLGAYQQQPSGGGDGFVCKFGNLPNRPTNVPFDYDGDGRTDISLFRPANGGWFILPSTGGIRALGFGVATDRIAPADFDGDGKTDITVYRPSAGAWYVIYSSNNTFAAASFGISEDLPAPADYDGDGKADLSVFRPSTASWYRLNSSNNSFFAFQFGANGDRPALGDFDGDGKADISVFRPGNSSWYRINSSNGSFFGTQFGATNDVITPADYDGDGKTDVSVFRPANGVWYRLNSSNGAFVAQQFGLSGDIPAPGDFDGDGKTDVSVFRPSEGNWYRLNSTTNAFVAQPFGANGDRPTPSAFQ